MKAILGVYKEYGLVWVAFILRSIPNPGGEMVLLHRIVRLVGADAEQ